MPREDTISFVTLLTLLLVIATKVCDTARGNERIETVFVRTNDSQSCPSSRALCLTLDDYLYNSNHYFTSDQTIIRFLKGEHSINGSRLPGATAVLSKLSIVALLGESVGKNDQPVVRINCTVPVRFIFKKTKSLYIRNIEFVGCGSEQRAQSQHDQGCKRVKAALEFHTVYNMLLSNVHISNSIGFGLLGINILGRSSIQRCKFHSNAYGKLMAGGNVFICYEHLSSSLDSFHKLTVNHSEFNNGRNYDLHGNLDHLYTYYESRFLEWDNFKPTTLEPMFEGGGLSILLLFGSDRCNAIHISVINCTFTNNTAIAGAHLFVRSECGYRSTPSYYDYGHQYPGDNINPDYNYNDYRDNNIYRSEYDSNYNGKYHSHYRYQPTAGDNDYSNQLQYPGENINPYHYNDNKDYGSEYGSDYDQNYFSLYRNRRSSTKERLTQSGIYISGCNFTNGISGSGGVYVLHETDSKFLFSITDSTFKWNSAGNGGALAIYGVLSLSSPQMGRIIKIEKCNFISNHGYRGGAIHLLDTVSYQEFYPTRSVFIYRSNFSDNHASLCGGHVFLQSTSITVLFSYSRFINGFALLQGGGIHVLFPVYGMNTRHDYDVEIDFELSHCIFIGNVAGSGGGLSLNYTGVHTPYIYDLDPFRDIPQEHSIFNAVQRTVRIYCSNFTGNEADNYGGGASISGDLQIRREIYSLQVEVLKCNFSENKARSGGGLNVMIVFVRAQLFMNGTDFTRNFANVGSAMNATTCNDPLSLKCVICMDRDLYRLSVYVEGIFAHNIANPLSYSSSTVVADRLDALIINNTQFLSNTGSSIHARQTTIVIGERVLFAGNRAFIGGAFHIDCFVPLQAQTVAYITQIQHCPPSPAALSTIELTSNVSSIHIRDNVAMYYGGGIAINEQCTLNNPRGLCFYQPADIEKFLANNANAYVQMENNTANVAGNFLYGGPLEHCFLVKMVKVNQRHNAHTRPYNYSKVGIDYFRSVFSIGKENANIRDVASDPYRVCFCEQEIFSNESFCTQQIHKSVFQGQDFTVSAIAIASLRETAGEFVKANLPQGSAKLESRQEAQLLSRTCMELTYTIRTLDKNTRLELTLECVATKQLVPSIVRVHFLPCPIGFNLSGDPPQCDCAAHLKEMLTGITCNINSQTLLLPNGSWVGNYSGEIVGHPNCPFDYCTQKSEVRPDALDARCSMDRSGILCGKCRPGYSLVFGSSRCLHCSNVYLLLLIPFTIAGILLVILLKLCDLTVSRGTLNGLILFANIIQVNKTTFFPHHSPLFLTRVLVVFVAWLNLDFGIETCFFEGMDAFSKTWLQFAFPVFIWGLVVLVIYSSRHSVRLSELIGTNAVQVLATLFLLSYAKLLRSVLSSVTLIRVSDCNGVASLRWIMDGNVPFMRWPHVLLFLVAVFATFAYIVPLTLLAVLAPYLQTNSGRCLLRWVVRIKPLLDAYMGPYKDKHRYWTGLMLVVRIILFITFAANATGNPNVNLFAIALTVGAILAWRSFSGRVYKSLLNSILETLYLINLGMFTITTLFIRSIRASQEALEYITCFFIGAALLVFIFTIAMHIYQLVPPSLVGKLRSLTSMQQAVSHLKAVKQKVSAKATPTESSFKLSSLSFTSSTIAEPVLREPLLDESSSHTEP